MATTTEKKPTTRQVAKTYFDAVGKRDVDGMAACWAPGSVDHLHGMAELSVPDGMREWFGALFTAFPDFEFKVVDIVADKDKAAVHWHATGTFNGSGKFEGMLPNGESVDITGLDLLTVRDGLVVHNDAYVNGAEMAQQLGALPPTGSVAERGMLGALNLKTRVAARLNR